MKIRLTLGGCFGIFLLLGLISSPAIGDGEGDDAGGIYYPMEPAALLSLLPPAPQNWKLTASKTKGRLSYALQPETYAVRLYTFVPPPPPPGVTMPPPPPRTVFLSLLDTGCDPERMRIFKNFKPSDQPTSMGGAKYSSVVIDGCQASQIEEPTATILTVKVSDRFLLTMRFINLEDSDRDQWVRLVQLPKLGEASAQAPQTPLVSGTITLESIDELNPSANSKLQSSFETIADSKKAKVASH